MAFVQIMEFEMESADAVRLLEEYAEEGKGVSVSYTHLTLPTTPYV